MVNVPFCGDHAGEAFMSVSLDDVIKFGRNSIVTSVGLGVLLVQAAQVQRRELGRALEDLLHPVAAQDDNPSTDRTSS
jgi:hypothetical protein